MSPSQTIPYLGASESELGETSVPRRIMSFVDQRKLFSHSGTLMLKPDALVLQGWREIPKATIENVTLTFTEVYTRMAAGGARGNYPSLGWLGSLGKPLVLDLRGEQRIYLPAGLPLVDRHQPVPNLGPLPPRLAAPPVRRSNQSVRTFTSWPRCTGRHGVRHPGGLDDTWIVADVWKRMGITYPEDVGHPAAGLCLAEDWKDRLPTSDEL